MKKEYKKYIYYIVVPLIVVGLYQGFNYITAKFEPEFAVYRPGPIDDCAKTRVDVADQLNFSEIVKQENIILEKSSQDNVKLYEPSACVSKEIFSFTYLVLDDFKIEHTQGMNSQIYQLSYKKIFEQIKESNKNDALTKKILGALEYYLNDSYASQFLYEDENFQNNQPLIGPKSADESGTYALVVSINLVKANIYQDREHNKLKDTVYFFDSLGLSYEKVGENNEEAN